MPVDPHPFQTPYTNRDAAALLAATKLYLRQVVADADEIRNTDFSGQYGGVYVRSLAANFNLNTLSTGPDDGANIIMDGAGNYFERALDSNTKTATTHTGATDVTIGDDDDNEIHYIENTGSAGISVYLPDVALRTKPIRIVDVAYNSASYNITVRPKSGSMQTIMGGSTFIIDSDGASFGADPDAVRENWG